MECELCGRNGQLVKTEIEDVILSVCNNCAQLGRRAEVKYDLPDKAKIRIDETQVKPEFASLIRNARNASGLTIEALGEKIGEKASILERIEKGMRPTNEVAKKLEKALKIKLLGQEDVEYEIGRSSKFEPSLGDVAMIKRKK
jgi:putative transcription factor